MSIALVTGSAGLIGSEACRRFSIENMDVVGIDNDMRSVFFGRQASTSKTALQLQTQLPRYTHHCIDIRNWDAVEHLIKTIRKDLRIVVHTAAQPSHDWAAQAPFVDFGINTIGTFNLLEATRLYCPHAVFIFTSTNKVYGENPNRLPFIELEKRWELAEIHPFYAGVDEGMSIDQTKHSLFGANKAAADLLVQEYGLYFGMHTVCFRGGCLTGPGHAGAESHGFLSYLMKCTMEGRPYQVFGYQGKQVRDNLHASDLVEAFWQFFQAPKIAGVYNIGGGRYSNCSVLEAIDLCEKISGKPLTWSYMENNRVGDHIWWISDVRRFQCDYPKWKYRYSLSEILQEIHAAYLA